MAGRSGLAYAPEAATLSVYALTARSWRWNARLRPGVSARRRIGSSPPLTGLAVVLALLGARVMLFVSRKGIINHVTNEL